MEISDRQWNREDGLRNATITRTAVEIYKMWEWHLFQIRVGTCSVLRRWGASRARESRRASILHPYQQQLDDLRSRSTCLLSQDLGNTLSPPFGYEGYNILIRTKRSVWFSFFAAAVLRILIIHAASYLSSLRGPAEYLNASVSQLLARDSDKSTHL